MKHLTRGIAPQLIALAAAGLVLLVTACNNPLEPPAGAPAAAGKGSVIIKLASPSGRTVMPADPVFSSFTLTLQRGEESPVTVADTSGIAGDGVAVDLSAGTWTAVLKGYQTLSGTARLAAQGSETVTVAADAESQIVTVALTPLALDAAGAENGEFSYNFTMPASGLTSAVLKLSTDPLTEIDLLADGAASGAAALAPGYYTMTVLLVNTNGQKAGLYEEVHIYSGLKSSLDYHLGNLVFANKVYIAGTLTGGRHWGTVKIYDNSQLTGDPIKTLTVSKQTAWLLDIPPSYIGDNVYAVVEDDLYGGVSSPVTIAIAETDVTGVELDFPVTIPVGKNAALRYKTATGSVVKTGSAVLNALDGVNTTQWEMGNTTNFAELELDFGFPVTANAIAIRSFSNYFTSVTVSYKVNAQDADWTQAAAHSGSTVPASTNGSTAWPLWFGAAVTGTQFKLRVTISDSSQVRDPGMYEFELYNAGFDRTALEAAIEDAEDTLEDTVTADDGTALPYTVYWATAAAKTAYQTAITAAKAVFNNPAITVQDTIDTAVGTLAAATATLGRAAGDLPTDTRALLAAIAKANILKDFPWVSANSGSTGKDVSYAADPQSAQSWERSLYPNQKWVTAAARTTYISAISAAENVASTSNQQTDVDAALGTLNAATGTYTGAFGAGTGAAIGANANIALRYQKVTASNRHNNAGLGWESAVDGSIANNKRWATSSQNSVPAYLELDFGSDVTIAKGEIVAFAATAGANAGRISAFSVDYYDDAEEEWVSVYTKPGADAIGGNVSGSETYKFSFDLDQNTTAQKFRLYITASNPLDFSIWEFRLITPSP